MSSLEAHTIPSAATLRPGLAEHPVNSFPRTTYALKHPGPPEWLRCAPRAAPLIPHFDEEAEGLAFDLLNGGFAGVLTGLGLRRKNV